MVISFLLFGFGPAGGDYAYCVSFSLNRNGIQQPTRRRGHASDDPLPQFVTGSGVVIHKEGIKKRFPCKLERDSVLGNVLRAFSEFQTKS
jgi:hypothetical protein